MFRETEQVVHPRHAGYNIREAVRKVAVATAFRALFLEGDRPNTDEKAWGLAIAVALFLGLDEQRITDFINKLHDYLQMRKEETIFRDPELYE